MKDLRDLKDLTIHDVKPLSVPQEANATTVCTLHPEKLKAGWVLVALGGWGIERPYALTYRSYIVYRQVF